MARTTLAPTHRSPKRPLLVLNPLFSVAMGCFPRRFVSGSKFIILEAIDPIPHQPVALAQVPRAGLALPLSPSGDIWDLVSLPRGQESQQQPAQASGERWGEAGCVLPEGGILGASQFCRGRFAMLCWLRVYIKVILLCTYAYSYICVCTYVCVYIYSIQILSHYRLLQNIKYGSLCWTVNLRSLSAFT